MAATICPFAAMVRGVLVTVYYRSRAATDECLDVARRFDVGCAIVCGVDTFDKGVNGGLSGDDKGICISVLDASSVT